MKSIAIFAALVVIVMVVLHLMGVLAWSSLAPMYMTIAGVSTFSAVAFWWSTRFHKK